MKAIHPGVPPHLVQRWLGHASLRTTSIYIDVMGPDERALAALMWYNPSGRIAPIAAGWARMLAFVKRWRERQRRAAADADALMAGFGKGAYGEARSRARDARRSAIMDGNRSDRSAR
ncbi:MAG TPA: hypothetical protein VMU69_13155 [Bradyrhizobium sp.]|nr:hypothetical protein [Bradyrhizobium sp.]